MKKSNSGGGGVITPMNTINCNGGNRTWLDAKSEYGAEKTGGTSADGAYDELLLPFFGPRTHGVPTDQLKAKRPYEAYFLPDAYAGRSDWLLTTIIDAVVSGNSFVTSRCLPLLHHDNPSIQWSTMKFDSTFVDYEPEQGVPRLLTYRSATFQDHMARRGIAFVVNHGFANTEGGRLDFFYKLAHLKHVLQETLDQDGLIQIVNCKNEYASISNGLHQASDRLDGDALRAHERGLLNFACVQKRDRGWLCLDEEIKSEMARNGVSPNTWITPPGMKAFTALEDASVEYSRAGNAVYKNLSKGESANDTFRGNTVFQCNDYHVDTGDVDVNQFVRERVIGDYFIIRDFAAGRLNSPDEHGIDATRLFNNWRHKTQIYSCDTDKWETYDMNIKLLSDSGVMTQDHTEFSPKFLKHAADTQADFAKHKVANGGSVDNFNDTRLSPFEWIDGNNLFLLGYDWDGASSSYTLKNDLKGEDVEKFLKQQKESGKYDCTATEALTMGFIATKLETDFAKNKTGGPLNRNTTAAASGTKKMKTPPAREAFTVPLGGINAMANGTSDVWAIYDWAANLMSSETPELSLEINGNIANYLSSAANQCSAKSGREQEQEASAYVHLITHLKAIYDSSSFSDRNKRAMLAAEASLRVMTTATPAENVALDDVLHYTKTTFDTKPSILAPAAAVATMATGATKDDITGGEDRSGDLKNAVVALKDLMIAFTSINAPFSFLCARPFRKYRMGSAVLMAAGLDTGFTAHAHEDVQVGDDPIAHVHVTHFTGWFSSTILDTKRIAVAHDVFCMGYMGGEGREFVNYHTWNNGGSHPYQTMFGGGNAGGDHRPNQNIFPMIAPWGYGNTLLADDRYGQKNACNPIDLSGEISSARCHGDGSAAPSCTPCPSLNKALWDWKGIQDLQWGASEAAEQMSRMHPEPHVNLTCFQTMQKVMNPDGEKGYAFGAYIPNTDHFGDHIGPGSRKCRLGGLHMMKSFNYDSLAMI